MPPARLTPLTALAAACAGAAVWCSLGSLALSDAGPRAMRVGVTPPLWWMAALVVGSVAAAWISRLPAERAKPLFFSAVLFLPWLPVRLPAALLLWAGPFVWLVWAAIAAAVLAWGDEAPARPPRLRAVLAGPGRAPWVAFALAAIVYNAAAWRLAPLLPGGDEPHYLVIAQSVWRDGDLRIENNHQRGDYLEYFGGALRPDYLKRGVDGQIYSIHLPGVPVLIAPVLAIGGYGLVKIVLALVAAAATAMAWRTAFLVTGNVAAAWFGWAGVAFAAPFLLLAFTVYPDGPGAVVVMFAFAMLADLDRRASRPAGWWAAAGVLPALLPWFHPRFAVLAAALGAVFACRALRDTRRVRSLVAFALVPTASALGWFSYYYAIYGRFDPSVAYGHYTQMSVGRVPIGLLGLLFDQQYGLMVYAPVFAVGAAGLVTFARSHRRLALEWTAIVVPYAVVTAMYHMWWGGFSSPARFVGATLLLVAVPLAAARASATSPATKAVQAIALGVTLGITAMLLAVEDGAFVFNVRDVAAPLFVWASQMADLTHALPSLFRQGPLQALAEAAGWTAAILAAWFGARLATRADGPRPGASALVALCAVGLAVTVAAEVAWRIEGVSGVRVTQGQLRTLEAAATPRGVRGVVLESRLAAPSGLVLERLRLASEPVGVTPPDAWLSLPFLPAGRYRLWADLSSAASFEMGLVSGRSDGPFQSWAIAAESAGALSRDVLLPVRVAAVRARGDAGARSAVRAVWLQPAFGSGGSEFVAGRRAGSARAYGRVTVYAIGGAYLEPGGLWTAGGRTADFVVQVAAGEGAALFTMRAGPVATPVQVRAGTFSLDAELAPGEERELAVPVSQEGSAEVTIRTLRGFRPSEADPASTDMRQLGVRLEAPAQNRATPPK
jgi:hypothetical protein